MTAAEPDDRPRFLTDEDFNMDDTEGLRLHSPDLHALVPSDVPRQVGSSLPGTAVHR